jgi:hypothetical protein
MYEVVAMVKQLGIPTWFMTLSCADLRWSELFQIVGRTLGKNITEEQVEALSYVEGCEMLNTNPVVGLMSNTSARCPMDILRCPMDRHKSTGYLVVH